MTTLETPPVRGRAKRGAGTLVFNQATVVGLPAHGVVPIAMLPDPLVPLIVQIKNSPDIVTFDQIQLHWNNTTPGEGVGTIHDVTAAEAADPNFVFELEIPANLIPALWEYEENQLEYEVGDIFAGSGAMSGLPVAVIFDRIIPGGEDLPAVLNFTDEQAHEVTEADMVADQLPVSAPTWYDMRVGDVLTPWLGTGPADTDGAYLTPMPAVQPGEDHTRFPVFFERADMVALGDKEQYFAYKLEDLAGNVSLRSLPIHAFVFLASPPGNFLAPVIPAATADGLVTEAETRPTALDVEIPIYDNPAEGQEIIVIWGGIEMPGVKLDASHFPPVVGDPLIVIQLSYADVVKGGIKVSNLPVSYRVQVGTVDIGESPATTINVDLTTPGGEPDPDPVTPEHGDLGVLVLTSDSGQVNLIPVEDFDKDAVITIPHLGVISGLVNWILGDEVTVTYKTTELPVVPITGTNVGADLVVPLLASVIGATGAGTFDVKYRIKRALTPATVPPQYGIAYSPPTEVTVNSAGEFPNNGNPLTMVNFPEEKLVQGNYYIQRKEGRDGTPIHVPVVYPNVIAGDRVNLRFVGTTGFNNPTGAELPDTEVLVTDYPIVATDLTRGYAVFDISAEIVLKICNRNGSLTNYSITNDAGPTNATAKFMNIAVQHKDPAWACIFPVPPGEP
ncbi:MAG TPA: hypothetical protein VF671_03055 [Pseudomonas sp.]|jgi:hypothetical protein|uniref:hypothetical protein n=1 Tax=Pseudomonas sp. TaxID=306 RepID=UPI002EDB94FB